MALLHQSTGHLPNQFKKLATNTESRGNQIQNPGRKLWHNELFGRVIKSIYSTRHQIVSSTGSENHNLCLCAVWLAQGSQSVAEKAAVFTLLVSVLCTFIGTFNAARLQHLIDQCNKLFAHFIKRELFSKTLASVAT